MRQARLRALGRGGGGGAWAGWRRLGGVEAGGQLLLEEHDEERFLEFTRSKDGQIVTINASTKTSSEARLPTALPWPMLQGSLGCSAKDVHGCIMFVLCAPAAGSPGWPSPSRPRAPTCLSPRP